MRYWFGLCLLKHNEKEANFSIILWLNVKIESLFTLDSSASAAWLLTFDHIHFCTVTVPNDQLVHVEKRHHHCDFYLPWNFEKQMVPCKTVMQLAMKLRTDSSGTGKLNHNLYSIVGTQHPLMPLRWTLLQLGPMLRNFYTMPLGTLGPGLGWRVMG